MHLVGILFPNINDDARSKSHQIQMLLFIRVGMDYLSFELRTRMNYLDLNRRLEDRQVSARVCWLSHGTDYRRRGFEYANELIIYVQDSWS